MIGPNTEVKWKSFFANYDEVKRDELFIKFRRVMKTYFYQKKVGVCRIYSHNEYVTTPRNNISRLVRQIWNYIWYRDKVEWVLKGKLK